jgi:hypothetical protein
MHDNCDAHSQFASTKRETKFGEESYTESEEGEVDEKPKFDKKNFRAQA